MNQSPPQNKLLQVNNHCAEISSLDNTLKQYRRSMKKYLFFPDLNNFYSNIQKQEYSLNQLIEDSKTLNISNDIETQFKQSKISSSCEKRQVLKIRSKNRLGTDHQYELNITQILNRFTKKKPQKKQTNCKRKNKHKQLINAKNVENPPIGFYNTNSFQNFKYPRTRTPKFFKQSKNKSEQSYICPTPTNLKQCQRQCIIIQNISQNLNIHPNKKQILELIPSLQKKQNSLKFIDTFYEGHKKFQFLFNNIKKKFRH